MISGTPISGETIAGTPGAFVPAVLIPQLMVTTQILQLPINCVVAGQQKEPVKRAMGLDGAISGVMKGIFNE